MSDEPEDTESFAEDNSKRKEFAEGVETDPELAKVAKMVLKELWVTR